MCREFNSFLLEWEVNAMANTLATAKQEELDPLIGHQNGHCNPLFHQTFLFLVPTWCQS